MKYTFTVMPEHDHIKLSDFLHKSGVSSALIKKIKFNPDGILVNGVKQNTNYRVSLGQIVEINTNDDATDSTVIPQIGELDIVYMDRCVMVVNKPFNMPCHPSFNHPMGTIANYFMGYWKQKGENKVCRIINRLDKNTSGLVLIALDAHTAEKLKGRVDKTYTAIIQGNMENDHDIIDLPIGRAEQSIITRCVTDSGQRAVTEYWQIEKGCDFSVLDIKLHTGRTHQIRVHFSYLGHPLLGDDLYGGNQEKISRHALHCRKLEFISPDGNRHVCVDSPLPHDMERISKLV